MNSSNYIGFLPEARVGRADQRGAPDESQLAGIGSKIWRLLAGQEPTSVAYPGTWLEWLAACARDDVLLAARLLPSCCSAGRVGVAVSAPVLDAAVAVFVLAYLPVRSRLRWRRSPGQPRCRHRGLPGSPADSGLGPVQDGAADPPLDIPLRSGEAPITGKVAGQLKPVWTLTPRNPHRAGWSLGECPERAEHDLHALDEAVGSLLIGSIRLSSNRNCYQ